MERLTVIRKRLIPNEEIDISGDEQLFFDENLLVTRWLPIRPRQDLGWGISHTYIKEGYKISAFFDGAGYFKYWYWDIIDAWFEEKNKLVVKDLLVDVVVQEDFTIRILDLEELEKALTIGLICLEERVRILEILKKILEIVLENKFPLRDAASGGYDPPFCFRPKYGEIIASL